MADIILKNRVYEGIDTVYLPATDGNMAQFSEGTGGEAAVPALPTPAFILDEGEPDEDGLYRHGLIRTTDLSYAQDKLKLGVISDAIGKAVEMFTAGDDLSVYTELDKLVSEADVSTALTCIKDTIKDCAAQGVHYPKYTCHMKISADAWQSLFNKLPVPGLDAHNLDEEVTALEKLWGFAKIAYLQPYIDMINEALSDDEYISDPDNEEEIEAVKSMLNLLTWVCDTVPVLIDAGKELLANDGIEFINVFLPEFQTTWGGIVGTALPVATVALQQMDLSDTSDIVSIIQPIIKPIVYGLLGGLNGTFEPKLFSYQMLGELSAVGLVPQVLGVIGESTADITEMVQTIINMIFCTPGVEFTVTAIAGGIGNIPSAESEPMTVAKSLLVYEENGEQCESDAVTFEVGGKKMCCSDGVYSVGDGVMFHLPEGAELGEEIPDYDISYPFESYDSNYTWGISEDIANDSTVQYDDQISFGYHSKLKVDVTIPKAGRYDFSTPTAAHEFILLCKGVDIIASGTESTVGAYLSAGEYTLIFYCKTDGGATSYLSAEYQGSGSSTPSKSVAPYLYFDLTEKEAKYENAYYYVTMTTPYNAFGSPLKVTLRVDTKCTIPDFYVSFIEPEFLNSSSYGFDCTITFKNGDVYKVSCDTSYGLNLGRAFTASELENASVEVKVTYNTNRKTGSVKPFHPNHLYRLGDATMLYPQILGDEVTGVFDTDKRTVVLDSNVNGMFYASNDEIPKAPTPEIKLCFGYESLWTIVHEDINDTFVRRGSSHDLEALYYDNGCATMYGAGLDKLAGCTHKAQVRYYPYHSGEETLSDFSNAVEFTTAKISITRGIDSTDYNIRSGTVETATSKDAYIYDSETETIVKKGACRCNKLVDGTYEIVGEKASVQCVVSRDSAGTVLLAADEFTVLRGSYSFVDAFAGGLPGGEEYTNYTYDEATGTFTFPDLREDVYILIH